MNTVSRGIRNAFRNTVRTVSIVIILSLSVGLIVAMLASRAGVESRIESIKSSTGNTISISPAGFRGFEGGGSALTSEQLEEVASMDNVSSVISSLNDRLSTDETTNLASAIEAGQLGGRFGGGGAGSLDNGESSVSDVVPEDDDVTQDARPNPMSSITITGVDNTDNASTFGGNSLSWVSGESLDPEEDSNNAVVGKDLAEENNLQVGSTFTAYDETLTVVGIYDAGTNFANNGVFVSLSTLQRISDQENSATSATVTANSLDNLASVTSAIEDKLGESADVTNSQDTAEQLTAPLESVKTITFYSLVGAVIAGSVIILLTMVMIVRERRREIGVMKAVGAPNSSIVRQFVTEALTLTSLSLVVGLAIGIFASAPITSALVESSTESQNQERSGGPGGGIRGGPGAQAIGLGRQTIENISGSVGVETVAYGIGMSLLIAVLGSAIPALMVSKIKPAEAMRSE